ncbi:helix-turn-helix transcriptional regulator [Paenibacillus rhizovicinus]|uniref:Helix-turn-helix transcriptional regulator n=1 Tax=Paenibacillus rhizovicinus TaxID=2704463 RepID=A0A6C0P0Q8_9BACL|nr:AraC family transcriptional regulator [Paenibacillus rhizovicinus]QHW31806.1 helix-turn-helix transcriptional regulator [Paenibacillus rhizovicinus]
MNMRFTAPPFPCFLAVGEDTYYFGSRHPDRSNLGVFDLLVVTKGALYITEEAASYTVTAGHMLILKPNKSHATYRSCDEETHFYYVHFQSIGIWSEETADGWTDHPHPHYREYELADSDDRLNIKTSVLQLPQFCALPNPESLYACLQQLLELVPQPQAWARWQQQLVFQNILQLLHAAGENEKDSTSLRLAEKVAHFLRTHYREPVSYHRIREAFSFHPTYLSRCMKQAYGMNLIEYLIAYRIEQAALLLIKTDLSVGEIAEQVGFANLSYLARRFAKEKGVNPSGYRKRFAT